MDTAQTIKTVKAEMIGCIKVKLNPVSRKIVTELFVALFSI